MAKHRLSKQERLKRYRMRIDLSRQWREQEGYDALWRRMIDLYRGRHFPRSMTSEDRIAVNIAFSTVNVIYPSISVNHPKVTIMANAPEHEDQATIAEAVTNYWWRHHDFRAPFRTSVKDFLIVGHGWLKIGWKYEEQESELGDDEYGQAFQEQAAEADHFATQNPDMAHLAPTDEEIAAAIPSTRMEVTEDRPSVERVSMFDIYVDPEATCMEDLCWIAQKVVRPLEDAKRDDRYSPSVRSQLQAQREHPGTQGGTEKAKREYGQDVDRVVVWEFYDIKAGTMSVFADSGDGFLVDPRPMPYAFGHPFVMIRNYDVPDQFYPMGDLEALECLQDELNKTRSQMMNHRKRYARKFLYMERSLGPEGRQALESDEDNVFVPVVDENRPLSEVIVPLQQTPIAPELYSYSDTIEGDMNTVSGVNEYARGDSPDIRRTATEAAIMQDAANARAADKLAVIESATTQVARRVVQIAQQYLAPDQVARVVGADGAMLWIKYQPEDIKGEFDFEVEAGSTQPMDENFRRQTAVAMMQALQPFIGVVIDPLQLARHVLQFGFGIKSPEKFLMQGGGMPPAMGGAPGGVPGMQPPPPGGDPTQQPPQDAQGGTDAVPPALLAQLQGQSGLQAPTLAP